MPSGYVTSDGKDLDARYLGINDKAKSAETADSATTATTAETANSVVWGGITEKPVSLYSINYGAGIWGTGTSYTCPKTGFIVFYSGAGASNIAINGKAVAYVIDDDSLAHSTYFGCPVSSGDRVTSSDKFYYTLYPVK